jgi:hypothetical protein
MSIQYKNKKTGDVYLLETACWVKISDNWVEGISYFNSNRLREMFVRTEEDFFSSFEEVDYD